MVFAKLLFVVGGVYMSASFLLFWFHFQTACGFVQMGIFLVPLVRVANHYWEEKLSLDNMGEFYPPHFKFVAGHRFTSLFFGSYILGVASQPSSLFSLFSLV